MAPITRDKCINKISQKTFTRSLHAVSCLPPSPDISDISIIPLVVITYLTSTVDYIFDVCCLRLFCLDFVLQSCESIYFFANLCYYVNSKLAELHAKEHITDIRG